MNSLELSKTAFWMLVVLSLLLLATVPDVWIYRPDSGIYIGTTHNLLTTGKYAFNGHPNLLYYPGMTALLALPIALFGIEFYPLNLISTLVVIALLFAARRLFQRPELGIAGLLAPFVMLASSDLLEQRITILSDAPFVLITVLAMLSWGKYQKTQDTRLLVLTTLLVALGTLFRFQGLVLIGAFAIALFLDLLPRKPLRISVAWAAAFATLAATPFVLWTVRDYLLYSPDTPNMVLKFFFGKHPLPLRAPGSFHVDWIDARWKYGVYNLLLSTDAFINTLLPSKLVASVPLEGRFIVFWGLVAIGARKWYPNASILERTWVVLILAFYAYWMLRSGVLYFTTRQMLFPALPFLVLFLVLGATTLLEWIRQPLARRIANAMAACVLAFVVYAGIRQSYHNLANIENDYRPANAELKEMRQYIAEHIPQDERLAVTDWGILPLFAKRESYPVLNDDSHKHSLTRIAKYRTAHLVILSPSSLEVGYAKAMVKDYPDIFTEEANFVAGPGQEPRIDIYSIDLEQIAALGLD